MKQIEIIAEIGNTHEGSMGLAKAFIRAAANCGVDGVKFQTHIFDAESLPSAPNPPYFKDESRKEYFDRTGFSRDQWLELKLFSEKECNISFMSSPFSLEAVDLLEDIGVSAYKVASGEVSNLPLLEKLATTGKTIYLSSGMSTWTELDEAIATLHKGAGDIVVMQCTSEYPCLPENAGLNVLAHMQERYPSLRTGFSDHTAGIAVPLAAVCRGAMVIEKHFTLSKEMYGPDARLSATPEEFTTLVNAIREVETALSSSIDKDTKAIQLQDMKQVFEKSIVANRTLEAGEVIAESDLAYKKPGNGIKANRYKEIIGMTVRNTITANTFISWQDLDTQ